MTDKTENNQQLPVALLEERLRNLREELELGQRMKRQKEMELQELTQRMLRISGAIQVLEELLAKEAVPDAPALSGDSGEA